MALSTFEDKSTQPTPEMLAQALVERYSDWQNIIDFVLKHHKGAEEVWNYGKSFGWRYYLNCKIYSKKVFKFAPAERGLHATLCTEVHLV